MPSLKPSVLRVRKHLHRCKRDRIVVITERKVRVWWTILNDAIFNGELKPYKRTVLQQHFKNDVIAYCVYYPSDRYIEFYFKDIYHSERMFITLLVHEMVHQWEYQMFGRAGHGKKFNSMGQHIKNSIGIQISEFINIKDLDEEDLTHHD